MGVRMYHPALRRTVEVNERRARAMRRSGWVPESEHGPSTTGGPVPSSSSVVLGAQAPEAVVPFEQPPAEEADNPTPSEEEQT